MAEYIDKNESVDESYLQNWYIDSVDEAGTPHWTEEHIEELVKDFIVIPIETPAADVEPVRRGEWLKTDAYPHRVYCSECYKTYVTNEEVIQGRGWAPVYCTEAEFCPHCGAKMGGEENA